MKQKLSPDPDNDNDVKTAGTARLLRHIASLRNSGRPVPYELTDQLAKKTQSTAARQTNYLDQNLPWNKPANWDATAWNRTGRSLMDLDGRWDTSKALADQLSQQRRSIENIMSQPLGQRMQEAWGRMRQQQIGQQQSELLNDSLSAQNALRSTGVDIGRFRGTIAPAQSPLAPTFNPLKKVTPDITPGPKRPIDLTQAHFPGLLEIIRRSKGIPQGVHPRVPSRASASTCCGAVVLSVFDC